jgi:hypothetical protein
MAVKATNKYSYGVCAYGSNTNSANLWVVYKVHPVSLPVRVHGEGREPQDGFS